MHELHILFSNHFFVGILICGEASLSFNCNVETWVGHHLGGLG